MIGVKRQRYLVRASGLAPFRLKTYPQRRSQLSLDQLPKLSPAALRLARSSALLGVSVSEAKSLAEAVGVVVRAIPDDTDDPVWLTADLRVNRINVGTRLGVVRRIDSVG